nr:hypothetical protein [Tanacetum cinerariifolium]
MKSRKKKILFSSNPKTSNVVRKYPSKKQVDDTQHAEEPVPTKGIESSESAEELRNQTKSDKAEKGHHIGDPSLHYKFTFSTNKRMHVHETIVKEVVKNSRITLLENLESSLSQQVADNIDDSIPKMVADALEERLPELLYDTIKNILFDLLKDSVKKALPKFDKRVKKTLRAKVPEIFLKPLNMKFNALNRMENR